MGLWHTATSNAAAGVGRHRLRSAFIAPVRSFETSSLLSLPLLLVCVGNRALLPPVVRRRRGHCCGGVAIISSGHGSHDSDNGNNAAFARIT